MSPEALLPRSGIPIAAGLENVYISIAGLIGAGKTTLARALGQSMGLPALASCHTLSGACSARFFPENL